jgi:hypothetical protein
MVKIAIFGSTGGTGKAALVECLQGGHHHTIKCYNTCEVTRQIAANDWAH